MRPRLFSKHGLQSCVSILQLALSPLGVTVVTTGCIGHDGSVELWQASYPTRFWLIHHSNDESTNLLVALMRGPSLPRIVSGRNSRITTTPASILTPKLCFTYSTAARRRFSNTTKWPLRPYLWVTVNMGPLHGIACPLGITITQPKSAPRERIIVSWGCAIRRRP